MSMDKEPAPKKEEQGNLDFRSKKEKERAFIDKFLELRMNGTFSFDSLSEPEKEIYRKLTEKERKEDKDYHGH